MVTPVVATSVLGFGILYWFGFAKLLPALGYEIDSNPDELVDGSRVVIYKVGFHTLTAAWVGIALTLLEKQRNKTGLALKISEFLDRIYRKRSPQPES